MKLTRRKVLVLALIVCILSMLSAGSLAWFHYTDSVKNVFMVTDSDSNGTPDFSMALWETGEDGQPTKEKEYKNLLPGAVLDKDPTVENTGNYDQYVRAYVTFSDASALQAACEKYGLPEDLRSWLNVDLTAWTADDAVRVDAAADTITYTYYLNRVLKKTDGTETDLQQLFTKVSVPGEFVQEDLSGGATVFRIDVDAEALQVENITANNAKEAFLFVGWDAFETYGE